MEEKKMKHFKEKLVEEHSRAIDLINELKENQVVNTKMETNSELSFYDNHPSDLATETFENEKGLALKANEMSIIGKIDDALNSIEHNTYGKCKICGRDISNERLESIPYATNCISCQKSIESSRPAEQNNRSVEEDVIGAPFVYSDRGGVGIDAEDTYQILDTFNRTPDQDEYESENDDNNGYVDPIEQISNEYYRSQLPD